MEIRDGLRWARMALLLLLAASVRMSWAAPVKNLSFEYVPKIKRDALADMFKGAKAPTPGRFEHKWSCDMYGMKTALQVERHVPLYDFLAARNQEFSNGGAQLVKQYRMTSEDLDGQSGQILDKIRETNTGLLVSQLTLKSSGQVLAYSVCNKQ